MGERSIIVCEPHCAGFEHHQFNAALLASAARTWEGTQVHFVACADHISWVRDALVRSDPHTLLSIEWHPSALADLHRRFAERLGPEFSLVRRTLELGARVRSSAMIFSSIALSSLAILKNWLLLTRSRQTVFVIPHALLATLQAGASEPLRRRLVNLRGLMGRPDPQGLTYLVLGEPIRQGLVASLLRTNPPIASIDHPCLWDPVELAPAPSLALPVRFGFFGVARDRFDQWLEIASETLAARPERCEFLLVGHAGESGVDSVQQRARGVIDGVSATPISPYEYARRAHSLTYAVWTADHQAYALRASNAFLDTLRYLKPGICLANPYVSHYFSELGDLGYLCGSVAEIKRVMLSVVDAFSPSRYESQRQALLAGRATFSPESVGRRLKSLIEERQID